MGLKESLKTAIFPLYENLAKIEQDRNYTTFCVQWGENTNPGVCCSLGEQLTDGPWMTGIPNNCSRMVANRRYLPVPTR